MDEIFNIFRGTLIVHPSYEGRVCGFNETHFILAVETTNTKDFFRVLKKDFFVLEEYKDPKYRYTFENEREIEKQMKQ